MSFGKGLMLICERETFVIRALIKKVEDAGILVYTVKPEVHTIAADCKNLQLVTCYLETGQRISGEVTHYLSELLSESTVHLITIGEKEDADAFNAAFNTDHIFKTFTRPLDSDKFVKMAEKYLNSMEEHKKEEKKMILVVDDDPTYTSLLREWLKDSYRVQMARSGRMALSVLSRNKPDLVLLDYETPEMNGPEVLEKMRDDNTLAKIPVIFLTGINDRESVINVVSMKPDGYLLKSIDRAGLLKEINAFFRKLSLDKLRRP